MTNPIFKKSTVKAPAPSSSTVNMPNPGYPITTYEQLKEAIQLWCDRDDQEFVNQIPNFIDFAQKEIYRTNRWMFMHKEAYLYVKNGIANLPSDYLNSDYMYFAMNAAGIQETSFAEVSYDLSKNKNSGQPFTMDKLENPLKFAMVGTRLFFNYPINADVPTQDDNGTGTVPENAIVFGYYSDPLRMTSDSDDPYLLTVAPDLLLYASCYQASAFVLDDDLKQSAADQVNKIIGSMNTQEEMMPFSASPKVIPRPNPSLYF